jgi:hypothetical protein
MSPMFIPGPVDVAPEVLAAQAKPMLPTAVRSSKQSSIGRKKKSENCFIPIIVFFRDQFRYGDAGSRHP